MKKLSALICGALLTTSAISFAAVSPDKIILGNITPGMTESEVLSLCGEPQYKHKDKWQYNNFTVEFDNKILGDVVEEIETKSSGVTTYGGVAVGQSAAVLNSTFGSADKVETEHNRTKYKYRSTDGSKSIEFKVIDGVIKKISCELD